MDLFTKLPGSHREPPGLEWELLKRLPICVVAGTAIPAFAYLYATLFPAPLAGETIEKYLPGVGIIAVAVILTVWTAAFTAAIGCVVVWIMKDSAYVADSYPLSDSERPATNDGRAELEGPGPRGG